MADHAMSWHDTGGFIHQRHNDVRDLIGQIATEILTDVGIEPQLLPVTGEQLHGTADAQNEARLDVTLEVSASGVSEHFFMCGFQQRF